MDWIEIGGVLGTLARFAVGNYASKRWQKGSHYGTLTVNLLGSFLLSYLTFHAGDLPQVLHSALGVGFLGSFTTFSTFAWELVSLRQKGEIKKAILYALTTISLGIGLAAVASLKIYP